MPLPTLLHRFLLSLLLLPLAAAAAPPFPPLGAAYAEVGGLVRESDELEKAGRFRDSDERLRRALGQLPREQAAAPSMEAFLAKDLILGRLADSSDARADDAALLAWLEQRAAWRDAFWGREAHAALSGRNALALQLCKVGRCREALALQEEIYRLTLKSAGPTARNTLVARHNLAGTLGESGRYGEALAIGEELAAAAQAQWGADDPTTLRMRNAVAVSLTDLGRFAEALKLHEQVYEARRRVLGPQAPDTLSSLASLSATYSALYRHREALAYAQRVHELTAAAHGDTDPRSARAASAEAIELRRMGRLGAAHDKARTAWTQLAAARGAGHPDTLYALNVYARVLEAQGRHEAAAQRSREALDIRVALMGEQHPLTLAAVHSLGRSVLSAGDANEALALFERAHEGRRALLGDAHPETLLSLIERMGAALAADRLDTVKPLMPRFQRDVEALRAQHGLSVKSRRALFERYVEGYRHHALASVRDGENARAFEIAELSKARTLIESTALQQANRGRLLPAKEQEAVDRHEAELARIDRSLDETGAQVDRRQTLEAERNRVVLSYADLQRRLRARYPKYAQQSQPHIASLADAKRLLPVDSVFLSYLLDGDRVMAFVVDGSGLLQATELAPLPGLADSIDAYRRLVGDALGEGQAVWQLDPERYRVAPAAQPPQKGAQRVSDAAPIGQWLSRRLIAPLQASIGTRRRLIVSPDGALAMLPFEALPVDGELLAQRHSVGYVQSLSMMELLQRRSASYGRLPPRKAMLAIGNPVYEGQAGAAQPSAKRGATAGDDALLSARASAESEEGIGAAVEELRENSWENLPGTQRELESIARVFRHRQVEVISGADATEQNLQRLDRGGELAKYRHLLFSVHGYLSPSVPALSALVLGQVDNPPSVDGYVTAAEWPGYTLRSDLVVMSACETGIGKVVAGDGVMGLPYALYVAGNVNTVMTLWPVSDESTARFMEAFFARIERRLPVERALAETKRAFAEGEYGERLRKPAYWAPFVLYGT